MRKLAHKKARIDEEMPTVSRSFCGTTIERIVGNHEHGAARRVRARYKNLDTVLGVLEGAGIARVDRRLYPVANIKGAD